MQHHLSESDLALYAASDLGSFARWRVEWHLRTCGKCQQEVTEFSSLRAYMIRSAPEPEVNWDRLAAEMKANIRLGLEAGECIAPLHPKYRAHSPWAWATLATAALIAIAAGSEIWINHPWSVNGPGNGQRSEASVVPPLPPEIMLEVTGDGIQLRDGDSVSSELHNNNRGSVEYSVNAQGGVAASYVDRQTGMVTVNNIYYGQ